MSPLSWMLSILVLLFSVPAADPVAAVGPSITTASFANGGGCDGCELSPLTYPDDYYAGDGYIDDLWIDIDLGAGSQHGLCDGQAGNCFEAGCMLGKVTIWITNNRAGDVVITGMSGGPSVIIPAGGGPVGINVGQAPALAMDCSHLGFFDALKLEIPNGETKEWIIAIRCTPCS